MIRRFIRLWHCRSAANRSARAPAPAAARLMSLGYQFQERSSAVRRVEWSARRASTSASGLDTDDVNEADAFFASVSLVRKKMMIVRVRLWPF